MPSWFLIEDNVVKDHTSIIMPFYSVYETAMNGACIYMLSCTLIILESLLSLPILLRRYTGSILSQHFDALDA